MNLPPGYTISADGDMTYQGQPYKPDMVNGDVFLLGSKSYSMRKLMKELHPVITPMFNPAVTPAPDGNPLVLMAKPSGMFQKVGKGTYVLNNRRASIPLKPT